MNRSVSNPLALTIILVTCIALGREQWFLKQDGSQHLQLRANRILLARPSPIVLVHNRTPNVFTFYSPLPLNKRGVQGTGMSHSDDDQLLRTWETEWRNAGWNPIVLNLTHAQQNVRYDEVVRALEYLPSRSKSGKQYNTLCFLRWLAMAHIGGGWMVDYDTFPLHDFRADGFVLPNDGRLTVWDNVVPSIVSGSQMEYQRTALEMVQNLGSHLNDDFYSDMKALLDISKSSDVFITRQEVLWGELALNGGQTSGVLWDKWTPEDCLKLSHQRRAVHISHRTMRLSALGANDRAHVASHWLQMWRESCPLQEIATAGETPFITMSS
jgi:hypothetical protein